MCLHLMISRNFFIAILCGFLLARCSQNNNSSKNLYTMGKYSSIVIIVLKEIEQGKVTDEELKIILLHM